MQAQAQLAAHGRQRLDLVHAVDQTRFGRLGDGDRAGLGKMNVGSAQREGADSLGRQLAVGAGGDQKLGSVREKLRGAAFVGLDMGGGRADHAVIGLAERGQRQRIGRRAVEGEEDLGVFFFEEGA